MSARRRQVSASLLAEAALSILRVLLFFQHRELDYVKAHNCGLLVRLTEGALGGGFSEFASSRPRFAA